MKKACDNNPILKSLGRDETNVVKTAQLDA